MNIQSKTNSTSGQTVSAELKQISGTTKDISTFSKLASESSAREVFRQITPKEVIKVPFTQNPAKNGVNFLFRAANGDDEVMSQEQKKS
jgi:hypothetical protein